MHISGAGVPTGVVSIPLRYMHSPAEMVELADVDATARLIAAFARGLPAARRSRAEAGLLSPHQSEHVLVVVPPVLQEQDLAQARRGRG